MSNRDDAAANGLIGVMQNRMHGRFYSIATVQHARRNIEGNGVTDKVFTNAGARNRARLIVRKSAGTDDRRVTDAPEPLIRQASGRGAGCQIAVSIERYTAYGPF